MQVCNSPFGLAVNSTKSIFTVGKEALNSGFLSLFQVEKVNKEVDLDYFLFLVPTDMLLKKLASFCSIIAIEL